MGRQHGGGIDNGWHNGDAMATTAMDGVMASAMNGAPAMVMEGVTTMRW